jgi:hypothetical protein
MSEWVSDWLIDWFSEWDVSNVQGEVRICYHPNKWNRRYAAANSIRIRCSLGEYLERVLKVLIADVMWMGEYGATPLLPRGRSTIVTRSWRSFQPTCVRDKDCFEESNGINVWELAWYLMSSARIVSTV